MRISILGTGSFASAITQVITDNNHEVLLWTNDLKQIDEINSRHTNSIYYDNFRFSNLVSATDDLEKITEFSNIIFILLPSKIISDVTKRVNKILRKLDKKIYIVNMSKGMDYKNIITISEIIENNIDSKYIKNIYSMTGPTFANEIIDRKLSKFILATKKNDTEIIRTILENEYILIENSDDIVGIEVLSSIKNIVALAAGILDGLGYKENTHAILITEGIREFQKIAPFFNIELDTILSVSGIGDLVLTASSKTSRNYITGKKIGSGEKIDDAIKTTKTVVEGVECAKVMHRFSKEHKINLPITKAVYNIFYDDKNPKEEILKIFK